MSSSPTQFRSIANMRQTPLAACLALAMGLAVAMPTASADPHGGTTLVVSNCDDSGFGTLRAAIAEAESGDTVDMSQLSCSVISLDSALVINTTVDNLTLEGAPTSTYGTPQIRAAPGNTEGLLLHQATGVLIIEKLEFAGGQRINPGIGNGGCVRSSGNVRFLNSAAKYCTAEATTSYDAEGGAIWAEGDVYLTDSLVSGSEAKALNGNARGGGVYAGGTLTIQRSTIRDNTAVSVFGNSRAGGAYSQLGGNIDNSTISGNEAELVGGLILGPTSLSVKIENSTISGNISTSSTGATSAAWISVYGNAVVVENNTITANVGYSDFSAGLYLAGAPSSTVLTSNIISGNGFYIGEIQGEIVYLPRDLGHGINVTIAGSHNLVGHAAGNVVLPADTIQQENAPFEPLYGPTGNIAAYAIGTGSWAFNLGTTVDNGPFDPPERLDQIGNVRNIGTGVDIGAVESDALFIGRFEDPPTF